MPSDPRLIVARQFSQSVARVAKERLSGRARHPDWSVRYSVMVDFLIHRFAKQADVVKSRKVLDQAANLEIRKQRVHWEEADVDGLRGLWAIPKEDVVAGGPVAIHLHGGGYGVGSVDSHRFMTAGLAHAGGFRVLGVDYRLAPEHPCPAAIEDAVKSVGWLVENGVSPERIFLIGDSAGGGLVLSTLVALRDGEGPKIAGGVCVSPWTDLTMSGATMKSNLSTDYLNEAALNQFADQYLGGLDPRDPRVSPLFADLTGLPPLLVQAGGAEILLDDAVRLAERAAEHGVDVTLQVAPAQVHVWHLMADLDRAAKRAFYDIAGFVHRQHG